jgi:hypothetical protein
MDNIHPAFAESQKYHLIFIFSSCSPAFQSWILYKTKIESWATKTTGASSYFGGLPQSGILSNSPPFNADSWATNPGAQYLTASHTLILGKRSLLTESTNSWTR